MTVRTLVQLAIAIVVAAWPSASRAEEPAFLTIEQRAADFASFCHFVEQEYAYFDLKTTDWERVCRFYGPQVDDAADRAANIELLERALGELYDQYAHLGAHTRRSHRLVPTHTDLFATWSNGRALISDVRSNSGADRAGLRPGMELVAINGESTETAVRSIEPRFLARADPAARQWALQVALAGRRDRGAPFPKPIVALAGRWTGSMGEGLAIGLNAARGSPVVGHSPWLGSWGPSDSGCYRTRESWCAGRRKSGFTSMAHHARLSFRAPSLFRPRLHRIRIRS
jgi:hypothetical protein